MGPLSQGAFDITASPLIEIWRQAAQQGLVPQTEKIKRPLPLVNIQDLEIFSQQVFLPHIGQGLDLGESERDMGLTEYGTSTRMPVSTMGRMGIRDPASSTGELLGFLEIEIASVVTSGNYEPCFKYGEQYGHHILDPKTGRSAHQGITGVTILDSSSTRAHVLATAVFVLGIEKGLALCASFHETQALIVHERGRLHLSEGMKSLFTT